MAKLNPPDGPSKDTISGIQDLWEKIFAFNPTGPDADLTEAEAFRNAVLKGEVVLRSEAMTKAVLDKSPALRQLLFMSVDTSIGKMIGPEISPKKYQMIFAMHSIFGVISPDDLTRINNLYATKR